ncbi:MAG: hypothetical protein R3D85_09290 [Paracoccaceae bacterium]
MVVETGLCPGMIDPEARRVLDAELREVAGFVAANAFPPLPEAEIRPRLIELIRQRTARFQAAAPGCDPSDSGRQDAAEIARNLARPGGQAAVQRMIGLPRLPVENDCPQGST